MKAKVTAATTRPGTMKGARRLVVELPEELLDAAWKAAGDLILCAGPTDAHRTARPPTRRETVAVALELLVRKLGAGHPVLTGDTLLGSAIQVGPGKPTLGHREVVATSTMTASKLYARIARTPCIVTQPERLLLAADARLLTKGSQVYLRGRAFTEVYSPDEAPKLPNLASVGTLIQAAQKGDNNRTCRVRFRGHKIARIVHQFDLAIATDVVTAPKGRK